MARIYENWLQSFVAYAAYGEAPLDFYFWTGISTIAGAIRRRVWIDQGHFQWIPNFYIILVAPPGIVSKSTTASIGMNLLRQVGGIKFGPDVVTWQRLAQSLSQSLELFDLGDGTMMPMSALTIESSELGNFLDPENRDMVDVLVSLWDGKKGVFVKSTKTQGEDTIENPFVNLIACTTPAWIEGSFPQYMIGGGFTSRCIFVFGDKKRQLVAYPKKSIPKNFLDIQKALISDLEHISLIKGEYIIDPAAEIWGEQWYEEHYKHKPPLLDNDRFAAYLSRKQTHIHKLAMVLAASVKDETIITLQELQNANKIVTNLEQSMPKVFDRIGISESARGATQLVNIVNTHGTIEQSKLYTELFTTMSWNDFTAALMSAIQAGHIMPPMDMGGKIMIRSKKHESNPTPNEGPDQQHNDRPEAGGA